MKRKRKKKRERKKKGRKERKREEEDKKKIENSLLPCVCVFSIIFFFLFGFSSLAHHIHTYTVHYASIVYTKEQYAGRTASPKTQSRCECSKYMICPSSPLIFLRSPVLFFVRQTGSPSFYFLAL